MTFGTDSFSADTASVLHSGIYNREFASVLASMAAAGLVYALAVMISGKSFVSYAAFILLLAGGFYFFRSFVFKSRYLEVIFDKDGGEAVISRSGLVKKERELVPLGSIGRVFVESRKSRIENPDGVAFVEKISLQHGMVIPGFGEENVSYLLKLKLSDGSDRLIFVTGDMGEAIAAHDEIREFLGG